MKKFTCMMLALLLCLTSVTALAESVPSKTTADLQWIEADPEKDPEDSGFYIRIVTVDETNYQERVEICTEEIAKLPACEGCGGKRRSLLRRRTGFEVYRWR